MEELDKLIAAHVQELVQVHTPEGELTESPLQHDKEEQHDAKCSTEVVFESVSKAKKHEAFRAVQQELFAKFCIRHHKRR